jgi:ABC-type Fe3+-hydroxamate transport system substrate-binding protein
VSPTSDGRAYDDLGTAVDLPSRVRRVVSLVPSLTETVARGAPGLLVGATDWCTEPADLEVTRVRGTKNPDIDAVLRLAPDLVLANEEENRPGDVAALRAAGLPVWVTDVRTVPDGLGSLARLLRACGVGRPSWLDRAEQVWRDPHEGTRRRGFVPVWRRPWMCLGRDTFAGDVLARLGVDNAFAEHAERYPRISLDEVRRSGVELVVLPDEPYAFTHDEGVEVFGSWGVPFVCVPGRLVTWYGPSLVEARAELSALLEAATG